MFDLHYCKKLTLHWPITVERYPSGQIGFVARPMVNGRRANRSFSTSKYPTPEEAANAAIAFCQEFISGAHTDTVQVREEYPIPDKIRPQISKLINQAVQFRVDPVKILSDGIQSEIRKRVGGAAAK